MDDTDLWCIIATTLAWPFECAVITGLLCGVPGLVVFGLAGASAMTATVAIASHFFHLSGGGLHHRGEET